MNYLQICKVLKIGVSKIDLGLSWIEVVHFRRESIGVGFPNRLQLGVVPLYFFRFGGTCATMQIFDFEIQIEDCMWFAMAFSQYISHQVTKRQGSDVCSSQALAHCMQFQSYTKSNKNSIKCRPMPYIGCICLVQSKWRCIT